MNFLKKTDVHLGAQYEVLKLLITILFPIRASPFFVIEYLTPVRKFDYNDFS